MTHVQHIVGLGIGGTAIAAVLLTSYVPLSQEPNNATIHPISTSPGMEEENLAARKLLWSEVSSGRPFFAGLGDLPGGAATSMAKCISGDGLVIVGCSSSDVGLEAFRWTPEAGLFGFGRYLGSSDVFANAVSADGNSVVGSITFPTGAEAFRWTAAEGVVLLGKLPGHTASIARAVSGDGSIVVGESDDDAFRWTADEGMVYLAGFPYGFTSCVANDISTDGAVIVGSCRNPTRQTVAFRWTESSGSEIFENTINSGELVATAVTADGTTVAGTASNEAFCWTANGGVVALGHLPGGNDRSFVSDISADGSVIVGSSEIAGGIEAFVWDSDHGMRSIRETLLEELDKSQALIGWKLTNATAVSGDGRVISGIGWNPHSNLEAWMARLGE